MRMRPRLVARPVKRGADLVAQDLAGHFLDSAAGEEAELERSVADADQAGHLEPEMFEDAAHLAVAAFAQGQRQPRVGPCWRSNSARIGP